MLSSDVEETEHDQTVLDRINSAYHALKKVFVINDELPHKLIMDLLILYDDVLSSNQVDLDRAYDGDQCFIHHLAKTQDFNLLQKMIELGADINARSKSDGNTAAHYITQTGDSDLTRKLIKALIENDADFAIPNENGFSPLDLCGFKLSRFVQQCLDENPTQTLSYNFDKSVIQQTFDIFDRTKTGYISIAEIKATIYQLDIGFTVSDNLLDCMFQLGDKSGDGQISFVEFERMIEHNINGMKRPKHDNKTLGQIFWKKTQHVSVIKNVPLDFIFIPRNIENNIAHINELDQAQKTEFASTTLRKYQAAKNDDDEAKDGAQCVWRNVEPTHSLIDAESVAKILQQCDLNFTKLERIYQLYFVKGTSAHVQHTFTKFEDFMKAFKNAEEKYKKKLKRLFYTFSEEHVRLVNGRLMFICLAGILAQYATPVITVEELQKIRADFVFRLLDVYQQRTVGIFEIAWLLRAACIFSKSEEETLKKAQLLLTACGAKGFGERVKKESFNEVILRFPNLIFIKVL